jgi:hypothetical protein
MALLLTVTLVLLFGYSCRSLLAYQGSALEHAVSVVFALAMLSLTLVFGLFPDGRFVPRSAAGIAVGMGVLLATYPQAGSLLMDTVDTRASVTSGTWFVVAGWVVLVLLGVAAQTYRYRHVSGPVERQQTKWVLFPIAIAFGFFAVLVPGSLLAPDAADLLLGWGVFLLIPVGIAVPLAFGNAVLRHRLYDIDRLLSRTASYALLTILLVTVYAGSVVGLSWLGRTIGGGSENDVAVAASTLAVVAVFRPMRRRIQGAVDRRFFRSRYDAERTIARFGQQLRNDGDLDALARDLRGVVAGTVQPRAASLWLVERTG